VKGEGNEAVLRELLVKFISKRYGVGTGVVIDRLGHQSRQCDIVIYDTFSYPSLLSLTAVHLFPVDIVYATVEVKTTLDSGEAQKALANIDSVRSLSFVPDEFSYYMTGKVPSFSFPTGWEANHRGGTYFNAVRTEEKPTPPVGCVFAYNSEAAQFETFKNWFTPKEDADASRFPTLVGCLDQGFVKFPKISPRAGMKPEGYAIPAVVKADFLEVPAPDSSVVHEGIVYPVKQIKGKYYAIDQARILLLFVLFVNDILAQKVINPEIRFADHYLRSALVSHILV
jgi:hypothetical protein